jgi:hypothetical protein
MMLNDCPQINYNAPHNVFLADADKRSAKIMRLVGKYEINYRTALVK